MGKFKNVLIGAAMLIGVPQVSTTVRNAEVDTYHSVLDDKIFRNREDVRSRILDTIAEMEGETFYAEAGEEYDTIDEKQKAKKAYLKAAKKYEDESFYSIAAKYYKLGGDDNKWKDCLLKDAEVSIKNNHFLDAARIYKELKDDKTSSEYYQKAIQKALENSDFSTADICIKEDPHPKLQVQEEIVKAREEAEKKRKEIEKKNEDSLPQVVRDAAPPRKKSAKELKAEQESALFTAKGLEEDAEQYLNGLDKDSIPPEKHLEKAQKYIKASEKYEEAEQKLFSKRCLLKAAREALLGEDPLLSAQCYRDTQNESQAKKVLMKGADDAKWNGRYSDADTLYQSAGIPAEKAALYIAITAMEQQKYTDAAYFYKSAKRPKEEKNAHLEAAKKAEGQQEYVSAAEEYESAEMKQEARVAWKEAGEAKITKKDDKNDEYNLDDYDRALEYFIRSGLNKEEAGLEVAQLAAKNGQYRVAALFASNHGENITIMSQEYWFKEAEKLQKIAEGNKGNKYTNNWEDAGDAYRKAGQESLALSAYNRALQHAVGQGDRQLAEIYEKAGAKEQAQKAWRSVAKDYWQKRQYARYGDEDYEKNLFAKTGLSTAEIFLFKAEIEKGYMKYDKAASSYSAAGYFKEAIAIRTLDYKDHIWEILGDRKDEGYRRLKHYQNQIDRLKTIEEDMVKLEQGGTQKKK